MEYVRLVLLLACASAQPAQACRGVIIYTDVVSGGKVASTQSQRTLEKERKADVAVAPQARVRCSTGGILVIEVIDDRVLEGLLDVDHVERDGKMGGHTSGVGQRLKGAALVLNSQRIGVLALASRSGL